MMHCFVVVVIPPTFSPRLYALFWAAMFEPPVAEYRAIFYHTLIMSYALIVSSLMNSACDLNKKQTKVSIFVLVWHQLHLAWVICAFYVNVCLFLLTKSHF